MVNRSYSIDSFRSNRQGFRNAARCCTAMPLGNSGPPHLLGDRRARPAGSGILASSEPPPAGHLFRPASPGSNGGSAPAASSRPPRNSRAGRRAPAQPRTSCRESGTNRSRQAASAGAAPGRSVRAAPSHPRPSSTAALRAKALQPAPIPPQHISRSAPDRQACAADRGGDASQPSEGARRAANAKAARAGGFAKASRSRRREPYLILVSLNSTCLRATGSYFFFDIFSVIVREFFFVT